MGQKVQEGGGNGGSLLSMYNFIYFIYISIFSSERESEKKKKENEERRERLDYFKAVCRWIGCRNAGLLLLDLYYSALPPPDDIFTFEIEKKKGKRIRMKRE